MTIGMGAKFFSAAAFPVDRVMTTPVSGACLLNVTDRIHYFEAVRRVSASAKDFEDGG